jgi:hypothetical protein
MLISAGEDNYYAKQSGGPDCDDDVPEPDEDDLDEEMARLGKQILEDYIPEAWPEMFAELLKNKVEIAYQWGLAKMKEPVDYDD